MTVCTYKHNSYDRMRAEYRGVANNFIEFLVAQLRYYYTLHLCKLYSGFQIYLQSTTVSALNVFEYDLFHSTHVFACACIVWFDYYTVNYRFWLWGIQCKLAFLIKHFQTVDCDFLWGLCVLNVIKQLQ